MNSKFQITIVGAGHVGLVSGACFAEVGHHVTCVDVDTDKIAALNAGKLPIYEPGLEPLVHRHLESGRLVFKVGLEPGLFNSEVVFLAVGTPASADGKSNLEYVRQAAADIGACLSSKYTVVATMSTVPVGTGAEIEEIIMSNRREFRGEDLFDVVSNPEFLREGSAVTDRLHAARIVIGAETKRAADRMVQLYEPFGSKIYVTDRPTAELAKYACNAFLATKISFINEIATICENVEADVSEIARIMGDDSRIGPSFLQAGLGYGGSCFPKDTRALDQIAYHQGHNFALIKAVIEVNNNQCRRLVGKVETELSPLTGKRLAILGLAFKPDTDDIREAPSLKVIAELIAKGAVVSAHDPIAAAKTQGLLPGVDCTDDLKQALTGADAMIVVTDWTQYRELDLGEAKLWMSTPVIFDGRNIFEPEQAAAAGFDYYGVGRKTRRRLRTY